MKKIAILSIQAGYGHKSAAEALENQCRMDETRCEVLNIDILQWINPLFSKLYTASYEEMVKKMPEMWAYFYDRAERGAFSNRKFQEWLTELCSSRVIKEIKKYNPDAIIATHFLPVQLILRIRERENISAPLFCVVTDHDIHNYWFMKDLDFYFVPDDEVKSMLHNKGYDENKIMVTGIPINPAFTDLPDKMKARLDLGLNPYGFYILTTTRWERPENLFIAIESSLKLGKEVTVIAAIAEDRKAYKKANEIASKNENLKVYGIVSNMHILMAASDLLISKAGGLTTSEAMAAGLPMLIIAPIPGQEVCNSIYLLENDSATLAHSPASLIHKLNYLFKNKDKLEKMSECARKIGKPFAAKDIISFALNHIK
ncbi:MAG: glycosyltransferase [Candidatus Coatesbacteria bacterium]|nr:glycosyltransferase [Candidatus Coatesbacteria bacterium]